MWTVPWIPLALSYLFLSAPVLVFAGKLKDDQTPSLNWCMIYCYSLFLLAGVLPLEQSWRLAQEVDYGVYPNYEFSIPFLWSSTILPCTIAASRFDLGQVRRSLTRLPFGWTRVILAIFLGFLGMLVVDLIVFGVFNLENPPAKFSFHPLGTAILNDEFSNPLITAKAFLGLLLGSAIFTVLGEELFYRQLLTKTVRRMLGLWAKVPRKYERIASIGLTSLCFGAMHWRDGGWEKVFFCTLSGVVFALVYRYAGNLCAPIAVHTITNNLLQMEWTR